MNLADERISNEDLFVWEMQSHLASPVDEERIKRLCKALREERERVKRAEEFILWCTPCGQESEPPTYEMIGKFARDTLAKLRGEGVKE